MKKMKSEFQICRGGGYLNFHNGSITREFVDEEVLLPPDVAELNDNKDSPTKEPDDDDGGILLPTDMQ